jgi:hypothetical protein
MHIIFPFILGRVLPPFDKYMMIYAIFNSSRAISTSDVYAQVPMAQ